MIDVNFLNQFSKINILQKEDKQLAIQPIANLEEIEQHMLNVINYLKVHSSFENIKAFIRDYKYQYNNCEETGEVLLKLVEKLKKVNKDFDFEDILFELELIAALREEILLQNSRSYKDWKISETLIFEFLNVIDIKSELLKTAIWKLEEFTSKNPKVISTRKYNYTYSEIGYACSIISANSKDTKFIINSKNAENILNFIFEKYNKSKNTVRVFIRKTNENPSIEKLKLSKGLSNSSYGKKLRSLLNIKEIIAILDKKNNKANDLINEIIKEFNSSKT